MKQPSLKPSPHNELYEVTRDFSVDVNNTIITVPRFFQYDGASIPAAAWQVINTPFNPRVMAAALIHDWLYYNHQTSQEEADDIFHALLALNGVGSFTRNAMWLAVRTAGGFYWENDEEDIDFLVTLAMKIKRHKVLENYHFPESVLERVL